MVVPAATYTGWALRADGLDGWDFAGQKTAFVSRCTFARTWTTTPM